MKSTTARLIERMQAATGWTFRVTSYDANGVVFRPAKGSQSRRGRSSDQTHRLSETFRVVAGDDVFEPTTQTRTIFEGPFLGFYSVTALCNGNGQRTAVVNDYATDETPITCGRCLRSIAANRWRT
jgi:hypothetical protein